MADSEPLLRSLGVAPKDPFDWGDEPQANLDPIPAKSSSTPSGLDCLKQFVRDKNNCSDEDDRVKRVLTSLLVKANVPLTAENFTDGSSNRKRYFDLLDEDGDLASRDVSIRGLSDRACAELTVESRSSLFGSILRLFDIDRGVKKGEAEVAAAETKSNVAKPTVQTESVPVAAGISAAKQAAQPVAADATSQIFDAGKDDAAAAATIAIDIAIIKQKYPMIAEAPILSTAEIVRSCHLTASPGDIPPCMDSKEYTMAALHFLSKNVQFLSETDEESMNHQNQSLHSWKLVRDTFPIFPLLMAVNPEESLEKRFYGRVKPLIELGQTKRKEYPDSMDIDPDFRRKVLNLERAYTASLPFASTTPAGDSKKLKTDNDVPLAFQKFVPRRKLCPRIETEGVKEELTLMISGHVQQEHQSQATSTKS